MLEISLYKYFPEKKIWKAYAPKFIHLRICDEMFLVHQPFNKDIKRFPKVFSGSSK